MKKHLPLTAGTLARQIEKTLAVEELCYGHGTDSPETEAGWLVSAILRQDRVTEIAEETRITVSQQERIAALLERRIKEKVPLAYLLQEAWFGGHCFYVDERVLIPRSPIAELIDNAFEPLLESPPQNILDLCCGSGCIGIACALAFPDCTVVLADLSADALAVARLNIERFSLDSRVTLQQSDLFTNITGPFDMIISNPPYVSEQEYRQLPPEYHHEPAMGLVSEEAGLAIPRQIIAQAADYLADNGLLILETGHSWQALDQLLPELPFLWLDFDFGGEGVCALSAPQLRSHCLSKPV